MDIVTHMLIGATVAQLPKQSTQSQSIATLTWQSRATIGAFSAIFPDIDYILFFWNPLEFLANWHRAETHSLLLSPLWAWLLSLVWQRYYHRYQDIKLLFKLSLAGILSHIISDSFTVFGTKWFAPFSDYQVSWDLLFVVDGYLTLTTLAALVLLIYWRDNSYRIFSLALPLGYLALMLLIKQNATEQTSARALNVANPPPPKILLPQPFSPFYWQVIEPTDSGFNQAYLKLANDVIAIKASELMGQESYQDSFQLAHQLSWNSYSVAPKDSHLQQEANQVWHHQKFSAFRQFAKYPVFYDYTKSSSRTCVWFSDLRYHWPNIIPSFRIGMCREAGAFWKLYRKKYFSSEQIEIIDR